MFTKASIQQIKAKTNPTTTNSMLLFVFELEFTTDSRVERMVDLVDCVVDASAFVFVVCLSVISNPLLMVVLAEWLLEALLCLPWCIASGDFACRRLPKRFRTLYQSTSKGILTKKKKKNR